MEQAEEVRLELKYCERCGGLWVRPRGGEASLCGPCESAEPEIAERYRATARSRKGEGTVWLGPMSDVVLKVEAEAKEAVWAW